MSIDTKTEGKSSGSLRSESPLTQGARVLLEPGSTQHKVRFVQNALIDEYSPELSWVSQLTGAPSGTEILTDEYKICEEWAQTMEAIREERRKTSLSDDMMKEVSTESRQVLSEVVMLAENVHLNRNRVCYSLIEAYAKHMMNETPSKVEDYRSVELVRVWLESHLQAEETSMRAIDRYLKAAEESAKRVTERSDDPLKQVPLSWKTG